MSEDKKPKEEEAATSSPQPGDPDYIPPMPNKGPGENIADGSDDTEELPPPGKDQPA